jgi:hypothetical protein
MKEKEFYSLFDKVENLDDPTAGYYPTVDELLENNVEEHMDVYAPLLVYFSNDPFKGSDSAIADDPDYKETVEYAKRVLNEMPLDPD